MQLNISVIVPTYRRPHLLQSCIIKLTNQVLAKKDYEIIIVSDGPDAESEKLVTQYIREGVTNIRYFALQAKKGPAAARNVGWKQANGLLIAFTDDDCLPDPGWLESIWKHYKQEAEVSYTGKVIVPVSESPTDFELNTKGLETGNFVTANCVVTRLALEAVNGFDEQFTTSWREDSDLEFKLLQRNVPIIKVIDAIVVHPVREAPWGISIKEQKKASFNALLYKKYPELFRQRIRPHPLWRNYIITFAFLASLIFTVLKFQWLSVITLATWLSLTIAFIYKRLASTRKSPDHILEMVVTSLVIPFLSVYWTVYGAIKYRVFYL